MGLFSWLFPKKKPSVSMSFAPASSAINDDIIREAFDNVMTEIELPSEVKEPLHKDIAVAIKSGLSREGEKAVVKHLLNLEWNWPEFDKWEKVFAQNDRWPYLWQTYAKQYRLINFTPKDVASMLFAFTVPDMKKISKELNIKQTTSSKKRQELEELLKSTCSIAQIRPYFDEKYTRLLQDALERSKKERCKILQHTLIMMAYSIRNMKQREKLPSYFTNKRVLRTSSCGCEVEDEIAKEYATGKLKGIPPFFPGDRTSLLYSKRNASGALPARTD
jgi:hypothetical protein